MSVESENCRWLLENLETNNTNFTNVELMYRTYGGQTNTAVLISPTLFVKASVDSLGFKRRNSSNFTFSVSENGTVLFVNSRSPHNNTVECSIYNS